MGDVAGLDLFAWQAVHLGPGFFIDTGRCKLCWNRSAPERITPSWPIKWTMPIGRGIAMETGNFLAPSTQERMTP